MSNHVYEAFRRRLLEQYAEHPGCPQCAGATEPERSAEAILETIDATVEGRCAGPGCTEQLTDASPSAWFHSPECQTAYHRQETTRPHEVRGSAMVGPDPARWRPDLVAADAEAERLAQVMALQEGGFTRTWFRRDSGAWRLRLDDGHRFVALDLGADYGGDDEGVWARLERELTDACRLEASEPFAPNRCMLLILRYADSPSSSIVYFDEPGVRESLIAWLRANALDPDHVCAGQSALISGETLTLDHYVTDAAGSVFRDSEGCARIAQVTVPLIEPPPSLRRAEQHSA